MPDLLCKECATLEDTLRVRCGWAGLLGLGSYKAAPSGCHCTPVKQPLATALLLRTHAPPSDAFTSCTAPALSVSLLTRCQPASACLPACSCCPWLCATAAWAATS